MATRKPLVVVSGTLAELPSGDTFAKADVGLDNVDNTSDVNKPISTATSTELNAKKAYHGVVSRTTNPLPTYLTTTTFTLSTTTYPLSYYYMGTLVTVSVDKSTILSGAAGLYHIYFDAATGNLLNSTAFPGVSFNSNVYIASVMWNGTDYGLVNDERHGYQRDTQWHQWAHYTVGTRYRSGITLTHNSGTGAAATFSSTAGEIWDEDILFTVNASSAFPTPNAGRLLYQASASNYTFINATSTKPGYLGANNRPNVVNSTGYVLTQVPSATNRFVNVFVYVTTDLHTPLYFFTETVSAVTASAGGYTSLVNARAVPFPNLSGLGISPELKPIYRIIWRADGVLQAIDNTQDDYRTVTSIPQGAGTVSTTASSVTFNPAGDIAAVTVQTAIEELDVEKQATLVSGTTIKTINGGSILGAGDLTVVGGLIPTAIKTSAYSGVVNDLVRTDSTSGAFTINMPTSPVDGDKFGVFDISNKCGINAVFLAATGGKTIEGDASGLSVNISGAYVYLIYNSTGTNWKIAETPSIVALAFADGGNARSNYVYGQSLDGGTA